MSAVGRQGPDGDPGPGEPGPRLTIQQVSLELGVPAPTLRSWERRYGVPVAGRSQGGHRRYSQDQVGQLVRMRDLVAAGTRPGDAAAQIRNALDTSPRALADTFVEAAHGLEPTAIRDVLETARQALGLDRAVDDVLLPAMRELGLRWETGQADVGHEHLASHATQTWLARVERAEYPLPGSGPVILCCGPRDHHTLGSRPSAPCCGTAAGTAACWARGRPPSPSPAPSRRPERLPSSSSATSPWGGRPPSTPSAPTPSSTSPSSTPAGPSPPARPGTGSPAATSALT
jgi:DNA-binding transcriptional MerR regulator